MSLHVRFIDLDHVGAGLLHFVDFFINRVRIGHDQGLLITIMFVRGHLGHGESTGNGDLYGFFCVGPQVGHIAHLNRLLTPNWSNHAWYKGGLPGTAGHCRWIIHINAFQGVGKAVEITLPADFTIRDDINAGSFLVMQRHQCGVVLGFFQQFFCRAPDIPHAYARGSTA